MWRKEGRGSACCGQASAHWGQGAAALPSPLPCPAAACLDRRKRAPKHAAQQARRAHLLQGEDDIHPLSRQLVHIQRVPRLAAHNDVWRDVVEATAEAAAGGD